MACARNSVMHKLKYAQGLNAQVESRGSSQGRPYQTSYACTSAQTEVCVCLLRRPATGSSTASSLAVVSVHPSDLLHCTETRHPAHSTSMLHAPGCAAKPSCSQALMLTLYFSIATINKMMHCGRKTVAGVVHGAAHIISLDFMCNYNCQCTSWTGKAQWKDRQVPVSLHDTGSETDNMCNMQRSATLGPHTLRKLGCRLCKDPCTACCTQTILNIPATMFATVPECPKIGCSGRGSICATVLPGKRDP